MHPSLHQIFWAASRKYVKAKWWQRTTGKLTLIPLSIKVWRKNFKKLNVKLAIPRAPTAAHNSVGMGKSNTFWDNVWFSMSSSQCEEHSRGTSRESFQLSRGEVLTGAMVSCWWVNWAWPSKVQLGKRCHTSHNGHATLDYLGPLEPSLPFLQVVNMQYRTHVHFLLNLMQIKRQRRTSVGNGLEGTEKL